MTTPATAPDRGPGGRPDKAAVTAVYGATFTLTAGDSWQAVSVAGELHEYSAPPLRDLLDEAIATGGPGDIVLDLTRTALIESTAMGVLVRAHRSSSPRQVFRIVAPAGTQPSRALRITGLSQVIPVHLSLDDALRAARTQSDPSAAGEPGTPGSAGPCPHDLKNGSATGP
ncbi:STAS domain-containing protein [Streptomyces uncialis]|uniref:STAS domain-containing protein n=1 Tax=Streptomyces uncialis TaxID=1048205 RepID=UPI003820F4FD